MRGFSTKGIGPRSESKCHVRLHLDRFAMMITGKGQREACRKC